MAGKRIWLPPVAVPGNGSAARSSSRRARCPWSRRRGLPLRERKAILTSSKYRLGSAELVSAATRTARSASTTAKPAVRQREGRVARRDVGSIHSNEFEEEHVTFRIVCRGCEPVKCAPRGACVGEPGNADLRSAVAAFANANREIGVPGLKADLQAGADAGWRRDRGSGE